MFYPEAAFRRNKNISLKACIFIKKETPKKVFSCEY